MRLVDPYCPVHGHCQCGRQGPPPPPSREEICHYHHYPARGGRPRCRHYTEGARRSQRPRGQPTAPSQWRWRLAPPANGHDVLLPGEMEDYYRLYLPDQDRTGRKLNWVYKHRDEVPRRRGGEIGYASLIESADDGYPGPPLTTFTKITSHREPAHLLSMPRGPLSPGTAALSTVYAPPPPPAASVDQPPHASTPTVVRLPHVTVELSPPTRVTVDKVHPEEWKTMGTHVNPTCLGQQNPAFNDCFLAYTASEPQTHLLVGDYAIHGDALTAVNLTRAVPSQPQPQQPQPQQPQPQQPLSSSPAPPFVAALSPRSARPSTNTDDTGSGTAIFGLDPRS